MVRENEIDVVSPIEAQARLCAQRGLPHFAPHNGICWSCRRDIYSELDGTSYVTGCPFCHRSYCD
jgi:hypothetical protein